MGHFHAIPDVVAVAGDRLVAIVRVDVDGSVVVRDLANCALSTTAASELSAPPALLDPTVAPVLSIVQATDTQWERAQRREAVIAGLASANNLGDQLTRASARLGISRCTVFRWLAAYRGIPQTLCLLAHPRGTPAGGTPYRRMSRRLDRRGHSRRLSHQGVRQEGRCGAPSRPALRVRETDAAITQGHPCPRECARHARSR